MDPANLARAFEELPEAAPSRGRLLGGFALGIAGALAAGTLLESLRRRREARREEDAAVDRAGEDTFPASDPTPMAGALEPSREER